MNATRGAEPAPDELAALADGSLEPARRAEVQAWLAVSPKFARETEAQRRAVTAVRGIRVRAPARLRARVEGARRLGEKPSPWLRLRRRWWPWPRP